VKRGGVSDCSDAGQVGLGEELLPRFPGKKRGGVPEKKESGLERGTYQFFQASPQGKKVPPGGHPYRKKRERLRSSPWGRGGEEEETLDDCFSGGEMTLPFEEEDDRTSRGFLSKGQGGKGSGRSDDAVSGKKTLLAGKRTMNSAREKEKGGKKEERNSLLLQRGVPYPMYGGVRNGNQSAPGS